MKIDENCINHNVVRLINEAISNPLSWINEEEFDEKFSACVIGEIRGILDMAEAMKEVLKA